MKPEIIDIQNIYEKTLNDLWEQTMNNNCNISPYNEIKRGYAIEREVTTKSILFISMNPSLPKDEKNNGNCKGYGFYKIPQSDDINQNTNPFFVAINKFYKELNCPKYPWSHHDFLFIRETDQKSVKSWMKDNNLENFFNAQLKISKEIINKSQPVLIVVLNAEAREQFKKLFEKEKCDTPFNEESGAFMYNIGGKRTPVLFTGMLSGQRALDLGSRQSLKWHINYILNK